jgi:phosphatidate cytidylyltransferase
MTWTRVATALVLIPLVIAIVLLTPTWVVAASTAAVTILALREYFALGDAIGQRAYRVWTSFCALILIFFQLIEAVGTGMRDGGSILIPNVAIDPHTHSLLLGRFSPIHALFLFVLGVTCITLWTKRPLVETLPAAGISSSGLLLVAFPLSFAVRLHGMTYSGPLFLLFALAITWAADTTAYFVGRAIGKHPLAPHISPKKTWEGSAGSMIGSLLVAYGFSYWIKIPLMHLLIMAVLGNIAGQMGDLLESAYKRSAGVKDSGGLLPGHGGVLDRIDALILCFPVIWYYLVLVNPAVS